MATFLESIKYLEKLHVSNIVADPFIEPLTRLAYVRLAYVAYTAYLWVKY